MAESASQFVYCDYNATAPLRSEARDAMLPWLGTLTGNPSSVHAAGQAAAETVNAARSAVARLIGARASEIVFTSGATEANNIALHAALAAIPAATLIVTAVEHPAVLAFAEARRRDGHPVEVIPVDADGRLDLARLRAAVDAATDVAMNSAVDVAVEEARSTPAFTGLPAVVSVMAANNETGIVFDLREVADITRAAGALLHTDATQRVGRLPTDVDELGVDLLSLSAHKFGGPMGVGALYISRGARLPVSPLVHGGEQDRGWRSGTLNVPGIAGLGAAAEAAASSLTDDAQRVTTLRERFETAVLTSISDAHVNGAAVLRLPGTSSIGFTGAPAQAVLSAMPDIAASDGSACASGASHASHVLLAMGRDDDAADTVLRFSFGHATTDRDVDRVAARLAVAVAAVRSATAAPASAQLPTQPAPQVSPPIGNRRHRDTQQHDPQPADRQRVGSNAAAAAGHGGTR